MLIQPALQGLQQPISLDLRRQAKLTVRIEQLDLADFAQVEPHRVFRKLLGQRRMRKVERVVGLQFGHFLGDDIDIIHLGCHFVVFQIGGFGH